MSLCVVSDKVVARMSTSTTSPLCTMCTGECNGAMVLWCNGAMAQWCNGAMVLWCYGAMVRCGTVLSVQYSYLEETVLNSAMRTFRAAPEGHCTVSTALYPLHCIHLTYPLHCILCTVSTALSTALSTEAGALAALH